MTMITVPAPRQPSGSPDALAVPMSLREPLEDLSPMRLRALPAGQLPEVAAQIRRFLIEKVTASGGHLGPNLGAVELTMALHRVFRSPRDVLLFDTGHQAYVHKVLTGRADGFDRLRQGGGLSGYPSRAESAHDVIENSHASTALSYADGFAKAFRLRGESDRSVVAVVGDGAMAGGMCWEAMGSIGASPDWPVIVVLNDNGRSYSPTVGSLAEHLRSLRLVDGNVRPIRAAGGNLFKTLGFGYIGPVDGHDILALERALRKAAGLGRPVVVHAVTVKGKGYGPAEEHEEDRMHAVGVLDAATGRAQVPAAPSWTQVFAEEIAAIGAGRPDVVAVTAAMLHPVGLGEFAARFPDRVFDVGMAEQHAVTSAAGLAMAGLHPVVAIYSTFLNRAFDQVLMDVALHRLPVTFVLDRAGVTGPDGSSHHGIWDNGWLPMVPGLRLAAPRDPAQLRALLREAVDSTGPAAIRYPKATVAADILAVRRTGDLDVLREDPGAEVLLVAVGATAPACLAAAGDLASRGVPVTVVDPRWIAPLDPELIAMCRNHRLTLAVEDAAVTGSVGARLASATAACGTAACGASPEVVSVALPQQFLPHDSRERLLSTHGLDAASICAAVLTRLRKASTIRTHPQGRPA
jgi:1-deoxy-D-xylulose-5-phosphate synthase